jgi:hypothetical protein
VVDLNRSPRTEQPLVVMALVSVRGHRNDFDIDEASFRDGRNGSFRPGMQNDVSDSVPCCHLGTNESPPAASGWQWKLEAFYDVVVGIQNRASIFPVVLFSEIVWSMSYNYRFSRRRDRHHRCVKINEHLMLRQQIRLSVKAVNLTSFAAFSTGVVRRQNN